jgi:signal transduction histidine kinase
LRDVVRFGIDFYATREAQREFALIERGRPVERLVSSLEGIEALLDEYSESIPAAVRGDLKRRVLKAVQSADEETKSLAARSNILAALATAGMTALAFEHEIAKQLIAVEQIPVELRTIADRSNVESPRLRAVADELDAWIERVRSTRAVFSSFSNEENRTRRERLRASIVLDRVWTQMCALRKGVSIDLHDLAPELRLPEGTFAEWTAVFQNVLLNAVNATLDTDDKKIQVVFRTVGRVRAIVIQDTGVGIDLDRAERLFEPFERALTLSPERRALGLGGTGLGLTIVRMVATNLGCKVAFIEPPDGYSTAFRLSWTEKS